jgi:hypothetical protein
MIVRKGLLPGLALLAAAVFAGQAGATGFSTYFALVATNGNTAKGSGVTSSTRKSVGNYEVTFGRPVGDCAYIATLRGNAGQITAGPKSGSPSVVVVQTFSATGVKQDRTFQLMVHCNS